MTAGSALIIAILMPPTFSLRVARPLDVTTLVTYSVAGFVLAGSMRRGEGPAASRAGAVPSAGRPDPTGFLLSSAIRSVIASSPDLSGIEIYGLPDPASARVPDLRVVRVIADVLKIAHSGSKGILQISFTTGRQPGVERAWIAAHYAAEPPLPYRVTIGRNDQLCERLTRPQWPSCCTVTWFDNGVALVYQVSIQLSRLFEVPLFEGQGLSDAGLTDGGISTADQSHSPVVTGPV